uniref:Uncharacterized protein n=1 Tax=Acrobeloides nanus TaxID=290746 RepID=A0A914ECU7_9BILA
MKQLFQYWILLVRLMLVVTSRMQLKNITKEIKSKDVWIQVLLTSSLRCGDLYEPVELITMTYPLPDRADHKCNDCHSIFKPCDSYCYAKLFKYEVRVSSFYCREKPNVAIPEKHGFMFGGLFTKGQINMFTGSASCPGQFQQYRMFHDTIVCLSRNYEVDGPLNIKFSGFFTCQSPPSEAQCPVGYTQHLATVENGCDAFYCVRPEEFNRFIPKRVDRPPFEDPSALTNDTESMLYVYRNNTFWFKQPLEPIIENATNQLTGKGEQNSNGISQDQLNDWIESVYLPSAIQAEKVHKFMHG